MNKLLSKEVDEKWLREIRVIIDECIENGTPYPQAATRLRRKMEDLHDQYLIDLREKTLNIKH